MFGKKPVRQLSPQEMEKVLDQINKELKTDFTADEASCERKLIHNLFHKKNLTPTLVHYPQNPAPDKTLRHYAQNPPLDSIPEQPMRESESTRRKTW